MVKVAPGIHTIPSADGAAGSGARSLIDTACSCLTRPRPVCGHPASPFRRGRRASVCLAWTNVATQCG